MADTYSKKAIQQKKAKKQKDKLERREERKNNNDKGKTLEEMTVYLDEFGNFTSVHPDKQKKSKLPISEGDLMPDAHLEHVSFTGVVSLYFHDKGYGFITEDSNKDNIFVHANKLLEPINEKDIVTYQKEKTAKGYAAIQVKKIK